MSGKIIDITKDTFEGSVLKSEKPVVVDFWASWCGPCRMVAPIMEELAEDYEGKVQISKVNVDDQGELAAQFRIMSIPTVLIFKDGQVAEKIVGARAKDEFAELIDKHL
ncbi:thioredoxin [Ruminiclostridium cellobioparum subsp. termitidis CT1112]|uniref:Thioredoxin n=2 Tax=Ruminiclostridium cellobioparum TaxID=29355 RepID=S0FFH2_RUMCE|nr:thioredoxin [Ruminiclostridium cellobioparum]EMS69670.1 thioredoxin [Ruminiclostridium cellobioparum subsp. termitidis CT1112]